ncbi:MAG TPA: hypothetical protein VIK01_17935 [Polyangiaceae bacterium]
MSITASSNYMSSLTIESWMEQKTDGLYGDMGQSMDVSNRRGAAEAELNKIKDMTVAAKGKDGNALLAEVNSALTEYADIPEVATALQPIAQGLTAQSQTANEKNETAGVALSGTPISSGSGSLTTGAPFNVDSTNADDWSAGIGHSVDALGKQDSLGLINIQEFNSQINQARQIASALLDSTNKTSDSIINHIG